MAQKFLDRAEISTSFEKMGREAVTEGMRCEPTAGRQQPARALDEPLNIPGIQTPAAKADKERAALCFRLDHSGLIPGCQIPFDCRRSVFTERNNSFLLPFS